MGQHQHEPTAGFCVVRELGGFADLIGGNSDFTAKGRVSNSEGHGFEASGCVSLRFFGFVHPMDSPSEFTPDPQPGPAPGPERMPDSPRPSNGGLSVTGGKLLTHTW